MKIISTKNILFLILIFIIGCSSSNTKNSIPTPEPAISPGSCLIIGEIVSIEKNQSLNNSNNICDKYPCRAVVKIDSVLGCGAGAPAIGKSDILKVKFSFTLAETTKEMFPNLEITLPGLNVNSRFKASIKKLTGFNINEIGRASCRERV